MTTIYVVCYNSEYQADNGIAEEIVGAFHKLEDVRKCYLKKFVLPFLKNNNNDEYFDFDAKNPTTKNHWDDIFTTFIESGSIEKVKLK